MSQPLVLPGKKYSRQDLADAAEDARSVVSESKVLQTVLAVMVMSRRLYMSAREVMDDELTRGWDVQNPGLIVQTLVLASEEKAVEEFSFTTLQQDLLRTGVPFLDILIKANVERQKALDALHAVLEEAGISPTNVTQQDAQELVQLFNNPEGLQAKLEVIKERTAAAVEST